MSVSDLEARIDDWVASNAEWVEDTQPHELTERNTEIDGSGATYYGIDVRFLKDDTKDNLLQKFTDKLKDKVDWYRVGYHECDHDAAPEEWSEGAIWDPSVTPSAEAHEWTAKDATIPSGVPDFPDAAYAEG